MLVGADDPSGWGEGGLAAGGRGALGGGSLLLNRATPDLPLWFVFRLPSYAYILAGVHL